MHASKMSQLASRGGMSRLMMCARARTPCHARRAAAQLTCSAPVHGARQHAQSRSTGRRVSTAAMGDMQPPSGQQQQQQQQQQRGAPAFELLRVRGDGSCMFRSIAQGAQIASKGAPLSPDAETKAANSLRAAVVEELAKRRSDLEPFIPGILEGDLTFEDYLQRMAQPGAWGGEPEMAVAVHVVRMPITVWRVGRSGQAEVVITYGEEHNGPQHINILWHQAGHYDCLVARSTAARAAAQGPVSKL